MLSGLMSKLRQPAPGEALPGRPEPMQPPQRITSTAAR